MGGVFAAYLLTSGIIVYRWVSGPKQPPPPISFLGATVIFGFAGLLAQADAKFGNAVAWGFFAGAVYAPKANIQAVSRLTGTPPDNSFPPDLWQPGGPQIFGGAPPGTQPGGPYPGYKNPDAPNYDPFKGQQQI